MSVDLTECSSPTPHLLTSIPSCCTFLSFCFSPHLPHIALFISCFFHTLFTVFAALNFSLFAPPLLFLHLPTPYPLQSSCASFFFTTSPFRSTSTPSIFSLSFFFLLPLPCSGPTQRAPGASPSAHNISSAAVSDRPNFSRGVGIRSTFHAGQQRGARDQQGSAYPGGPASPSLSHGNSQARRTHGATGIFSKFTSKFVRR